MALVRSQFVASPSPVTFARVLVSKMKKIVKTKGRQQNQDRTAGRIGLRIGSDRIGLVFSLIVQKNYFEKSCF